MNDDALLIVFVTCTPADADKIAEDIINRKLAACVNILPARSVYYWEDKLCHDEESLLIIKTIQKQYENLQSRIKTIHPYDTPEIVAIRAEKAEADYLKWVREQTDNDEETV